MSVGPVNTNIDSLGAPKIASPLRSGHFVGDSERILYDVSLPGMQVEGVSSATPMAFEKAGARKQIFFDPSKLKCALATCGGLCPGVNNVIRSLVLSLHHGYGVRNILGIRYGLQGFIPKFGHPVWELTPESVSDIHQIGGTVLSSSRGPQDVGEIVDALERMNIGALFMIGGDGTFRAAAQIVEETQSRGGKISVIGIPKTIDNDIMFLARSFGFNTAVTMAAQVLESAHAEALGAPHGVGLVKVMGRHSGFIACTAALAGRDANFVLIPEADFDMEGPHGFLNVLEKRLREREHAVIVAAEGAGQIYCSGEGTDLSGNVKLGDIGLFLKQRITEHFAEKGIELNLKYIDPSYFIRSVPATAGDAVFCGFLAQNAVHAAMAGKTNMFVGIWNDEFVHVPFHLAVGDRKRVDLDGRIWQAVLEGTGQPSFKPDTR